MNPRRITSGALSLLLTGVLFATHSLALPQEASVPAQQPRTPAQWSAIITNPPGFSDANYDQALDALFSAIEAEPSSPWTELAMTRMQNFLERATDRRRHLERAARLLQSAAPGTLWGNLEFRLRHWKVELTLRNGEESGLIRSGDHFPGVLSHAAIIGPFGDLFPCRIDTPFAPESGLAVTETTVHPETGKTRRWRLLTRRPFQSHLDLNLTNIPGTGPRYAKFQVRSKTERSAWLAVSAPGSVATWFNGTKIHSFDADTATHPDLDPPVSVTLRAGWNQILVKIDGRGADWMVVRFIDSDGRTISDLEEERELLEHPPAAAPANARQLPAYLRMEDRLVREVDSAQGTPDQTAIRFLRGWFRSTNDRPSEGLADLQATAKALPGDATVQYILAEANLTAAYLPQTEQKNRAKDALDKALAASPKHVPALLLKADLQTRDDKMEEALATLADAALAAPRSFLVSKARAQTFQRLQWSGERRKALDHALELAPERADLLMELSREAESAHETELAASLLDRAAAQDRSNGNIVSAQMSRALRNGEAARVITEQEKQLRIFGDDRMRSALVSTYEQLGKYDRAIELQKQIIANDPESVSDKERLLHLMRAARKDEDAEQLSRTLLSAHPTQESLRTWHRYTQGNLEDEEFFAKHRLNCMDAIKNYKPSKEVEKAPDALIVDQQIERVFPDGSVQVEITSVTRVNDQEGIRQHGSAEFRGELLELKVVHPDGTWDEPTPAKGDYALPNLKPGDFVLVRSRDFHQAVPGEKPMLGQFSFQSTERAYLVSQYVLALPKNTPMRLVERNFDGEHETVETDSEIIHVYTKTQSPRVLPERSAPDPRKFLPWVRAGISQTPDQLYRAFRAGQLRAMDVTGEIRDAAKGAITAASATTDLQKAEALYKFTNETLVERGGGTATRSLIDKRGNPAALYGALLKAADVPFDLAVGRPIIEGADDEPEPEFLDTSRYNSLLFQVRPRGAEPLWVDFTAKFQPFNSHPFQWSGAEALLLGDSGPERVYLPRLPMEEAAQVELETLVNLKGGQEADVKVTIHFKNVTAWGLREQIRNQTADNRKVIANSISNRFIEGIELQKFDFPGMDDSSKPFQMVFEGNVKNFLREGAGSLESRLVLAPEMPAKEFAGKSKRKLPVRLRDMRFSRAKLTIIPGPKQQFGELPQNVTKSGYQMNYELKLEKTADKLTVERVFSRTPGTIPAAEFQQFLALCREIEETEQLKVVIQEK